MPRVSAKSKPGPAKQFDTELRVYVTRDMYENVELAASDEQRNISNMVRVLIGEALATRSRTPEAEMKRVGESSA